MVDSDFIPSTREEVIDLLTDVWADLSKLTPEQYNAVKLLFPCAGETENKKDPGERLREIKRDRARAKMEAEGYLSDGIAPLEGVTILTDEELPTDAAVRGHPFTSEEAALLPRNVVLEKLREFSDDFDISLPPDLEEAGADILRGLLVDISDREDVRRAWEEHVLKEALSAHFMPLFREKIKNGLPTGEYLLEHPAVAEYLRRKYRTLSFNGVIYIYDRDTGIFRPNNRDLEDDIRLLIESMTIRCSISREAKDILFHVKNSNIYREYPFNQSKDLIPVQNGVVKVDGKAGAAYLLPHSHEYRFNFRIPVDYDPDIDTAPMMEVLRSWVMQEDVIHLINPVSQAICQMQQKDTLKRSYILQGSQNGGKSTCIQFMEAFLGADNYTRASLHQICTDRFILAKMEGRLLCTDEDLKGEELKDSGRFKALTGGVTHGIERKHENPYDGLIFCSFIFACNNPPKVDEETQYDTAFWSRWCYINFPYYHETNLEFKEKIFTEPYFKQYLRLVVDGVLKIHQSGGRLPDLDMDLVKLKWTTQMDTVGQYLEECFSEDTSYRNYDREAVYAYYIHWCKHRKVDERRIAKDLKQFSRDANRHHFESTPTSIKDETGRKIQVRVYRGKLRIREVEGVGLPDGKTLESFSPSSKESLDGYF